MVYVVWGSTYLAIRLAVREGSGFPPFTLGAARLLVAGALLMVWAAWRGGRGGLKVSGRDRGVLAGGGLLLWVGGNGSLVAFTSYLQALRLLPISLVTTYAYVNPVIAVILGRLVLGEPVTTWTAAGFTLVLMGVLGVFRNTVARASG